jgi:hypothetical protein
LVDARHSVGCAVGPEDSATASTPLLPAIADLYALDRETRSFRGPRLCSGFSVGDSNPPQRLALGRSRNLLLGTLPRGAAAFGQPPPMRCEAVGCLDLVVRGAARCIFGALGGSYLGSCRTIRRGSLLPSGPV